MDKNAEIERLKQDIEKLEIRLQESDDSNLHELRRRKARLMEQLRLKQTDGRVILG